MAKSSINTGAIITIIVVIVVLLFTTLFLVRNAENKYRIENKYYGFELSTPKGWIAQENTTYLGENVEQAMLLCQKEKNVENEIGAFRFRSSGYPEDLSFLFDTKVSEKKYQSGVVLEVIINCVSDDERAKINLYSDTLKVGGEKTLVVGSLNTNGLSNPVRQIYFYHGNLKYNINEYIYISPDNMNSVDRLKSEHTQANNKIISSFAFIK